jgi:O-antigen/teichoic acid export membrane protein
VAFFLPPLLVRMLSSTTYNIWALILQLSAYIAFLDFGIQTAVGRFVAHATEVGDQAERTRIVSTALVLLAALGALGLGAIGLLAWQLPELFPAIPAGAVGEARAALLMVGGSTAVGLPASVFLGVFIGLQRNEVPAVLVGGSRIAGALALAGIAALNGGLLAMAGAFAAINLATYAVQWAVARRLAPDVPVTLTQAARPAARTLIAYCASLSVWSFATLLVTGLDTTLVGIFDFAAIVHYTIAVSFITVLLGLQNALFGALIPEAAILGARADAARLGRLLIAATRYGMLTLLGSGLPLILLARPLLTVWVGPVHAGPTAILLQVLVIANIIRLAGVPYAMLLIGTGQQRLVLITPLVEGFSNLLVSVAAGALLGAVGVALGTLIGSTIGMLAHIFYNIPRTQGIAATPLAYLRAGIGRPVVCTLPALLLAACVLILGEVLPLMILLPGFVLAATTSAVLCWQWGLDRSERERLSALLRRPLKLVTKA